MKIGVHISKCIFFESCIPFRTIEWRAQAFDKRRRIVRVKVRIIFESMIATMISKYSFENEEEKKIRGSI